MATKKRDDQSNQILPSENSTIKDVKNKIENDLQQHNVNERETDSTCETESSSDEMRNSSSSVEPGEIDHQTLGWKKVSDRKMNGKTSDPKERSQEIVNRLFSRLGKDDKISSELKEEKWKKEKDKRKDFEGKVIKDQARKELDGKGENSKKQKSFERLKEQRKSVQLNGFDDKSDQENAHQEIEKKDKFCKIKLKKEDTDDAREREKPNSAATTAEELSNPRKDSGPALNSVKTEAPAIFCNGVKVVLAKPERKILLEKKIAVERIKMGASKKTIIINITIIITTIVIIIIVIIITIIVIIDRDSGAGWDEGK